MASKFKLDGVVYSQNDKGTHFYKLIDGKKTRIAYPEFEEAFDTFWDLFDSDEYEKAMKEGRRYPLEVTTQKKRKKKSSGKKRRSKDIAFVNEDLGISLTSKQKEFIIEVLRTNTAVSTDGIWIDVLNDEIGGQFTDKPMTVGAMISTLKEKGIVVVDKIEVEKRKVKVFNFTEIGDQIIKEVK